jgi:uncharacterized membrane protein YgdD (TMEM256/DUF423 family)
MTGLAWIRVGAVLGFLAVAAGAFGAHALRGQLKGELEAGARGSAEPSVGQVAASRRLEVFETGVKYHFWHALGLIGLGLLMLRTGRSGMAEAVAGWGFTAGVLLFSGSLYGLGLTGIAALGIVPVFGGLAFLAGWVGLMLASG